jgi:hypothetical protein
MMIRWTSDAHSMRIGWSSAEDLVALQLTMVYIFGKDT